MTKIGVVGAGYWGSKIINEYLQLSKTTPELELTAICDKFLDVSHFDSLIQTQDHNALFEHVDAVHICTPNETHYQICRDALEKGKHVLVEKPMTLNPSEAHELVNLADKNGLVLSVGHIFRFNNALLELRSRIREGYFGDIKHLRLQWTALIDPPKGRDIVWDLAPHAFDILNYLLDDWPIETSCEKTWERAYISVKLNRGVTAHIELGWCLPNKTRRVTVFGTKRIADCDSLSQKVFVYDDAQVIEWGIVPNNTMKAELLHFVESINNKTPYSGVEVKNSGFLGAKVVEILYSCEKTQTDGRYSIIKDVEVGDGAKIHDHVNLYKCKIGKNCKVDAFVYVEEGVVIGDNCKIRPGVFIPTGVTIENNVFIGPNVSFTNDKYPKVGNNWKLLFTRVKSGASIGAGAVILPGITIGEKAMVGAGAVVTKDVPDYAVVIGNPAKKHLKEHTHTTLSG